MPHPLREHVETVVRDFHASVARAVRLPLPGQDFPVPLIAAIGAVPEATAVACHSRVTQVKQVCHQHVTSRQ